MSERSIVSPSDAVDSACEVIVGRLWQSGCRVAASEADRSFRPSSPDEAKRAAEAKERLRQLVLGQPVRLRTTGEVLTFDRTVAVVEALVEGVWMDVAQVMRREGLTKQPGDTGYHEVSHA